MGVVVWLHSVTRKSAKSSAVTSPPVTSLIFKVSSRESHTSPRRKRVIVDRLHSEPLARTSSAIDSSTSPLIFIHSANCMDGIVHGAHNLVKPHCAWGGLEQSSNLRKTAQMARAAKKPKPIEKPTFRPTYLRDWRLHHGLSLEKAGAYLGKSHSQLGRIETGKQEYTQRLLENAARLYQTSVWALLYCPPGRSVQEMFTAFQESIKVP